MRVVHGDKELVEKLGRRDPCPCGSGRRFQRLLPHLASVSSIRIITSASNEPPAFTRGRLILFCLGRGRYFCGAGWLWAAWACAWAAWACATSGLAAR
ncbi:MAG: SEC-C metal-binding domain-containing protein [Pseudomonadota bacterium]